MILKQLQSRGVLAIPAGDNVVRFLPPFTITAGQLDAAVATLEGPVLAGLPPAPAAPGDQPQRSQSVPGVRRPRAPSRTKTNAS